MTGRELGDSSPIEYVFELTEVYTAVRNRERGVKCIELTVRQISQTSGI